MAILHCEVRSGSQQLEPGHWFFDEGNWALCAEAGKSDAGQWALYVRIAVAGKDAPSIPMTFSTLKEAKAFLAEYFERPVVRVRASEMPEPDGL
jgi:hypothetical protein